MTYVKPDAEELAKRGRAPDGSPLKEKKSTVAKVKEKVVPKKPAANKE